MTKLISMTAALFLGTATIAMAQELSFVGESEYAFEAEEFTTKLGVQYDVENVSFIALVTGQKLSGQDLTFEGLELTAAVDINTNVTLYAIAETDGNFDYEEATIGAAFKF